MLDLENVGAELAEPGGDLPEHAGPVGDGQAERDDAVLALELAHHHRGQDPRIDVAAAQNEPDLAAAEALRPGQHRAQPGGAGALRHGLLQGQVGVDRALEMRLVDEHDLGDELAHDRQRERAHVLHGDAFRQRRPAERAILAAERVPERRIERRLDPDDLDRRRPGAGGDGVAGDQPAAADRDHQGVEVVRVLEHFQRDRALARDHQRVVVGMDEGEAALGGERLRAHLRLRHALALEHDLGAVRPRRLDLHERRGHRHHDGGRDAQPRGVVGDRLGVVAGGHGDHAPRPRGGVERGELVERAAVLERVGDLEILVFHMDVGAGQRRELGGRQHRRAQHLARDRAARRLDVRNGDAHRTLMPDLLPAGGTRPDGAKPRASCARTVYSPFAGGVKIASTAGGDSTMTDPRRIGVSIDVKPHAYDPAVNPELFEGVLARRFVAFLIDVTILAIPVMFAAVFIFIFGVITLGIGWALYWLLSPAAAIWAICYYGYTFGSPASATIGMRVMDLEMRTWYGAPAYFVLGAVHAIVYWVTVSFLTPFILLVAFFNHRRRLLHDMLVGTIVINNPARAQALRAPPP